MRSKVTDALPPEGGKPETAPAGGNGRDSDAAADSPTVLPPENAWFLALKRELHQQVIGKINLAAMGTMRDQELRMEVRRQAETLCEGRADLLNRAERERLINEVLDETFGLGPLEPLMRDAEISDILINGPKTIYVERRGRLQKSSVAFHDADHVLQVVQRIVGRVGRRVDETCPMVDARLPDGSRLNAIIHPVALEGPLVSIRRFGARPLLVADLLANHSLTPEMLRFLAACIAARVNVVISGGTGSGKTTLLNALSNYIPPDERVATIEDAAELQLQQPHVVRMETRPPNIEGQGEITTRDLVRNTLRMRPDRIIVGECRGAESLDMLQAMNTGHEGSLTTIHANSPRDALSRLETMVGMAGFELPVWVIRRQVASSINLVVQVARLMGGVRRIVRISEITGMEQDIVSMQDIFEFKQTGLDEEGVAVGHFMANGIRPACLQKLEAAGRPLPAELFERRTLTS
jgi:pilus assembly protein CpaF